MPPLRKETLRKLAEAYPLLKTSDIIMELLTEIERLEKENEQLKQRWVPNVEDPATGVRRRISST